MTNQHQLHNIKNMEPLNEKKRTEVEQVVINATCEHFGLDVEEFIRNRSTDTVSAYRRHACYYLIRQNTMLSFDSIALLFKTGKSTIQCGFYKIEGLIDIKDRRIVGEVEHIQQLINNFIRKSKEQSLSN
jgi:chromosomal replication initiation ATPase DnaA